MNRNKPCPCGSGRKFGDCHGVGVDDTPIVIRPLIVHAIPLPDGRVYKVVGSHPHQVQLELIKTERWLWKSYGK